MKVSFRAPGKVVLFGEYGVLIGLNAYGLSANCFAYASYEKSAALSFYGTMPGDDIFQAVLKAAHEFGLKVPAGCYRLDTKDFIIPHTQEKIGIGSSSAGIVAIGKVILHLNNKKDQNLLFQVCLKANGCFSGEKASGLDIAISVYEGLVGFNMAKQKVFRPKSLQKIVPYLHVVHLKKSYSSKNAVELFFSQNEEKFQLLKSLLDKNSTMIEMVVNSKRLNFSLIKELFKKLDEGFLKIDSLTGLGTRTKEHDVVVSIASKLKGAAKVSGAGGGDISLVLLKPKKKLQLEKKIEKYGLTLINNILI